MSTRPGSPASADVLLAEARGRRNQLALSIKSALLALDRNPAAAFPATRQEQAEHERRCLQKAMAALLEPPPEVEPSRGSMDAELRTAMRNLDAELGLAR